MTGGRGEKIVIRLACLSPVIFQDRGIDSFHRRAGAHLKIFSNKSILICSSLIAQVLSSNKVLFRLEIQRVDFLRSGVAQQEWRSVRSEAHPRLKV